MSDVNWTDDRLLAALGAALDAADPVPDAVAAAAKASLTWLTIDAELAALVFDSAAEEAAGVRAVEAARQMTFRTPGIEIELVVLSEMARRLVGQLVPPQSAEIELHHRGGTMTAPADELGRFTFEDVPTGSIRLICKLEGEGGNLVTTEWVLI